MKPLVVSGDLIASRSFGAARAATTLAATLEEANKRFADNVPVPFELVQGDAFQGLVNADSAPRLLFFIQASLITRTEGRLKSRFGLGLGTIDQDVTTVGDPGRLTGPAFVAAAEALAQARKERRQLVLKSERSTLDNAANGTFGLIEYVWNRWSPEVWRRALRYDELEDVGKLADELGVSYQAVHKQLHARGILAVREALLGLGKLLEEAV